MYNMRKSKTKNIVRRVKIVCALLLLAILTYLAWNVVNAIGEKEIEAQMAIKQANQAKNKVKHLESQVENLQREIDGLRNLNELLMQQSIKTDQVPTTEWKKGWEKVEADETALMEEPGMDTILPGSLILGAELLRQIFFRAAKIPIF